MDDELLIFKFHEIERMICGQHSGLPPASRRLMEVIEKIIVPILDIFVDGEWRLRSHSFWLHPEWLLRKARILETKEQLTVIHI